MARQVVNSYHALQAMTGANGSDGHVDCVAAESLYLLLPPGCLVVSSSPLPHLCVFDVAVSCRHQLIVAPLPCPALGLLTFGLLGYELQLVGNHLLQW